MSQFRHGLAEIFEIEEEKVQSDLRLADVSWDSLAIVSTIALIDEVHDISVDAEALSSCETVGEIEQLVNDQKSRV